MYIHSRLQLLNGFSSQVTEQKDFGTEQEHVVDQEAESVGVASAPAAQQTSTVQELNNLSIESPAASQEAVEATNQISDDVIAQMICVQEDTQTLTNQVTAVADTGTINCSTVGR